VHTQASFYGKAVAYDSELSGWLRKAI